MKINQILKEQWSGDFKSAPSSSSGKVDDFKRAPSDDFKTKPGTGGDGFKTQPGTGGDGFKTKPGAGAGGKTADPFACLKKDADIKLSSDGKTMTYAATRGTWTFYLDNKFTYTYKSDGSVLNGTWECNGADKFKIKTDDGDSYDSTTEKWAGTSGGTSSSSPDSGSKPKPKLTDTSLTLDDLKAGKEVSKGMRGPVVGEIQKLLIAAGFKNISKSGNVDNIFGSRTKASVEQFQEKNTLKVDGIVGDETIKALISAPPASSSSSSSEDPNRKPFDPNAEKDNSIPSTDGTLIEKKKVLQESLKKMLRKSLLKYS